MQKGGKTKNLLLLYNCVCLFCAFCKGKKKGTNLTLFSFSSENHKYVGRATLCKCTYKREWKSSCRTRRRRNSVQNGNGGNDVQLQSILVETICHLQKKRLGKSVSMVYTASGTSVSVQIIVQMHENVSKTYFGIFSQKNRENEWSSAYLKIS